MSVYNETHKNYTMKYNAEHYEDIRLRTTADGLSKAAIREAANAAGESVNAYILEAVRRRIASEKERTREREI